MLSSILGCSPEKESFTSIVEDGDWEISSHIYGANGVWHIESNVHYSGHEQIRIYWLDIIVPPPIEITARQRSNSGLSKLKSETGDTISSSTLKGSENFSQQEMKNILEKSYLTINYLVEGDNHWHEKRIILLKN